MSLNITDLNNAKLDIEHIAALATSSAPTAVDRFGNVKKTLAGAIATVDTAAAQTAAGQASLAKVAAEAARDAALIQSGVYVDEPTGRATVQNGQAFKVQGMGDVAAYEYRRINSSSSVLIASYPSTAAVQQFKGTVAPNSALSSVAAPGVYYLTPSGDYTDMPAGIDATKSYALDVIATVDLTGRWRRQEMHRVDKPEDVWVRRLDTSGTGTTAWFYVPTPRTASVDSAAIQAGAVTTAKMGDKAVTRQKLHAEFDYQGSLSSGNTDTLTTSGTYLVTAAMENLPTGAPTSGYLIVRAFNNASYVLQEYVSLINPTVYWRRYIRPSNNIYGPWALQEASIPNAAVTSAKIADKAVGRAKLHDSYNYAGNITGTTDANALTMAGLYLATAKPINGPSAGNSTGYLTVENFNSASFVVQTWRDLVNPEKAWVRYIRPANNAFGPWTAIGAGAGSLPLAGQNIVFIGDSITELGDYPARVAKRLGVNATEIGFGGCRMAKHSTTSDGLLYDKMCMYNLARYVNIDDYSELLTAADNLYAQNGDDNRPQALAFSQINWAATNAVVIFFGTNDWAGNVPLGTTLDADGTTFLGAINYAVDKLMSRHPHLKVMFIAPIWRARNVSGDGLDADTHPNGNGAFLVEFADSVIERANANKLPALDMYRNSGINKYNHTTMLADGLHPTSSIGCQHVADKIAAFISATI